MRHLGCLGVDTILELVMDLLKPVLFDRCIFLVMLGDIL